MRNREIGPIRARVATLILVVATGAACTRQAIPYEPMKMEGVEEMHRLMNEWKHAEAETLAREALASIGEAQGSDSLEASVVIDILVYALLHLHGSAEPAEIRELAERAVEIKQRILGDDHLGVAESLANLGLLELQVGRASEAAEPLQRALEIRIRHLGETDGLVAESQNALANAHVDLGEYVVAEPLYRQALETTQELVGEDHADVASHLYNLARLYRRMGDFDAARPLFEGTLEVIEKNFGYMDPWYTLGLNGFALLLEQTGDYNGAREQYERALEIAREVHGSEHPAIADYLNNLGLVYRDIGDYDKARSLYNQALKMHRNTRGNKHPHTISTLRNLGELHFIVGEHEEAKALYQEVLALRRDLSDDVVIADSLLDLGKLFLEQKEFTAAEPYFEEALEIFHENVGRSHHDYAQCLTGLAHVNDGTGNFDVAKAHYQEAATIREHMLGPDHPDTAASLLGVARVAARAGDVESALEPALRAETIARDHLRLTSHSLAEREALRYAAVRTSGLHLVLSLAARGLDPPARRRVWDATIRSRALVLDEMAARHRTLGRNAETARLSDLFEAASRRLANLMVQGPDPHRPEHYPVLLDEARGARERTERALAGKSAAFRQEQAMQRRGLAEVSEGLPPGSALVAFVQYEQVDIANPLPGPPVGSYLAFVLAERHDPVVVPLGSSGEIDELIRAWRIEAERVAGGVRRYLPAAEALRRRIWDPIAPLLEDVERAFVVPDGELHLLNLYTLPMGEGTFLIERGPRIHYLSAERDLVPSATMDATGEGLLAIGGVDFDGVDVPARAPGASRGEHSRCPDFRTVRFGPLPASARESLDVVELWRAASAREENTGPHGGSVVHLTAAEASEAAFKENAPGKRVLHLATHGFFVGGECRSALQRPRGIGGLVPAHPRVPVGENPLLLSGVALAGANHRDAASPDEEDGILTAQEIAAMDLSGVEWAVLSACDTGLGDSRAGEGVFGLRRALQIAGVRTLIMSLGPVEDETAREWMRIFYEGRLLRGRQTIEAVQEASLELLRERRASGETDHPAYWAPFVAVGQWN